MLSREEEGGSSTLRVLVATDCHLGYLEKDEERRFDSFDTFEEICSLAEKHKVNNNFVKKKSYLYLRSPCVGVTHLQMMEAGGLGLGSRHEMI